MKKERLKTIVRRLGARRGPRPYAHLTDAELTAAFRRAQRGEDTRDVKAYPGPVESWPATGLEHLSNAELRIRAKAVVKQIRGEGTQ